MIPRLIGFSGKKRHGKNTVATLVDESMLKHEERCFEQVAFADHLKTIAAMLCVYQPWPWVFDDPIFKEKDSPIKNPKGGYYTNREILQKVGTEFGRNTLGPDVWVDTLFVGDYQHDSQWLVTDVRFPNEVAAIEEREGIVIRVIRPGIQEPDEHESETALDNHAFKYVIFNDGTLEDLASNVELLLEHIAGYSTPCTIRNNELIISHDPITII